MSQSVFWIDAGTLRDLLERASRTEASDPAVARDSAPRPTTASDHRPEGMPSHLDAAHAGAATSFEPPPGNIDVRVEAFLDWLGTLAKLDGAFITDSNGLAIASRGAARTDVAISAELIETLREVRRGVGSDEGRMAIALGPSRILHIATIETPWGSFAAGLIGPEFLRSQILENAQQALARILGDKDDE